MSKKWERVIENIVIRAGEEENYEIICYGIDIGINYALFLPICILISILMGNGMYGIWMMIPFYFLRIYAGGYHASTKLRCWIISTGLILLANICLRYPIHNAKIAFWVTVLLMVNLYVIAPVETKTKRLSDSERNIYKKRVGVIIVICLIVILAERLSSGEKLGNMISASLVISNILGCAGMVSKK